MLPPFYGITRPAAFLRAAFALPEEGRKAGAADRDLLHRRDSIRVAFHEPQVGPLLHLFTGRRLQTMSRPAFALC